MNHASINADNTRLIVNGQQLISLPQHDTIGWPLDSDVRGARFSPDFQFIFSRGLRDELRLHDGLSGKEISLIRHARSAGMALNSDSFRAMMYAPAVHFSNDGSFFAAPLNDGLVELWSYPDLQMLTALSSHASRVSDVVFRPDDRFAVTVSIDGVLRVWDLDQAIERIRARPPKVRAAFAFSPVADLFATLEGERILLIDLVSGHTLMSYPARGVEAVFFDPRGDWLYTVDARGNLLSHPMGHRPPSDARKVSVEAFPHIFQKPHV